MSSHVLKVGAHHQRGAALLVALMILVMVSLLGISAMRTSMFNAKISTSVQASSIAFQAAESAISAALDEAASDPAGQEAGSIIQDGISNIYTSNYVMYRCITPNSIAKTNCSSNDRLDVRGVVQSRSKTVMSGDPEPVLGNSAGQSGNADGQQQYNYTFYTLGIGELPDLSAGAYHIQDFKTLGPGY